MNMTREQARKIAIYEIQELIMKQGEDDIFCASPVHGHKQTWTNAEALTAATNDTCLVDSSMNPIDSILKFENYLNDHKRSQLDNPKYKELLNI